ncbi:MAG: RNA polymerase sigma factor [Bacteroidetes bacterium]|nr:RNA polymerase sigma factor [Bacteroidota bacterium]
MNPKQYNQIVDEYADGLYRFILKNIRDEETAQDVVQDAFEKVWLNHEKVEFLKAKSYLFTTAYHTMIDHIRKNKRIVKMEDYHENAMYYSYEYSDVKELLNRGLEMLPASQKSVLLLRDYEGYSYEEIEGITGLNENQVKVYIHRARLFLRAFIQRMEGFYNGN